MTYPKEVYEPREDSSTLAKYVAEKAHGSVLDMGTGSGIQAVAAAEKNEVQSVLALDIQREVIQFCQETIQNEKITFEHSDLFRILEKKEQYKGKKFDTIIFNPPYLPQELKERDVALEGGRHGYEVIEKFLNSLSKYLKQEGICLLVFSSFTNKDKVHEIIERNLLEFTQLDEENIFFEGIYVYEIKKSKVLVSIEEAGFEDLTYFAKGKRGFIFTSKRKGKKVAIKVKNPKSEAGISVKEEISFLTHANTCNIGPRLVSSGELFLAYLFVEGVEILEFITKTKDPGKIVPVIHSVFKQLFDLDQLSINKNEMSHPDKHILVTKEGKPVLIDFERSQFSRKPSNVSQFCDYMISTKVTELLSKKKIIIDKEKLILAARTYKNEITKKHFNDILSLIS